MWEYMEEKVSKRMNEWKVTKIMLFQFSFISPHVILVLLSGCLVRVSASFIRVSIFPRRDDSKGLLFSNNGIFLSKENRLSHTRHTQNVLVIH